jgi:YidC/Oxa1 family membrane protein insertase
MWNTFIVEPMTNILLIIYSVLGNFGIAIILFTILIRLLTHPLMATQIKSSRKMQEINQSKEWQEIQKKYKGDREKLSAEQMKLYQSLGYNPLSGCLPTLIQFPVIIGLYQSITHSMAASPMQLLTLTRSIWEPLSASFAKMSIPVLVPINQYFLGMNLGQPYWTPLFNTGIEIPILAILVALTTYVQSKLTVMPSADPQSSQMNNMMTLYMPIFLGYITLNYASGLAIYFITTNLVGIAQYAMLGKVDWGNVFPFMRGRLGIASSSTEITKAKPEITKSKSEITKTKPETAKSKSSAAKKSAKQ